MGVRLGVAIGGRAPVHIEVGHHAAGDELLAHEVLHQADRLPLAQLARQGDLDLAGQLTVPGPRRSLLPASSVEVGTPERVAGRHLVPQRLAVEPARGCALWQHDLAVDHARLVLVVLRATDLVVEQAFAGPVSGSGDDPASLPPADDLGLEMKDRHAACVLLPAGTSVPAPSSRPQAKAQLLYKRAFN